MSNSISELPISIQINDEDYLLIEQNDSKKISISDFKDNISRVSGMKTIKDEINEFLEKEEVLKSKIQIASNHMLEFKQSIAKLVNSILNSDEIEPDYDSIINGIKGIGVNNSLTNYYEENVRDMSNLFDGNKNIVTAPMFNASKVTDMSYMFNNCTNLTTVPMYNTSNVLYMKSTFSNCKMLKEVYLDTTSVTSMASIFKSCASLTKIRFNPDAGNIANFAISDCTKMTSEDLVAMFESLPIPKKTVTITLGTTLLDRLSEEQRQIAIDKKYKLV